MDSRYWFVLAYQMGATQTEISRVLGFSVRSIRDEVKRNSCGGVYLACQAQRLADQRRRTGRAKCRKSDRPEIRGYVTEALRRWWSPEQIAGRMRRDFPDNPRRRVSHQTIYNWLARDDHGPFWSRFLRGPKPRKRREISPDKRTRDIAGRPADVNAREFVGDWEGDTIVGRGGRASVVSLIERLTGFAELIAVENRCADTVEPAIERRLRRLPSDARNSITFDNGSEFAAHQTLTAGLGIAVYFATPHSPWQRGSNEHLNRLARDYLPKGSDFRGLDRRKLAEIQRLLNNRPRKRLKYQTPAEIFAKYCRRMIES